MKECAELSICKRPTGRETGSVITDIYIKDLYGSNTPFPLFMKFHLTISLFAHDLFPVKGSFIHYL
jgi:hypothetical protein